MPFLVARHHIHRVAAFVVGEGTLHEVNQGDVVVGDERLEIRD
jgi:hypothetical protein